MNDKSKDLFDYPDALERSGKRSADNGYRSREVVGSSNDGSGEGREAQPRRRRRISEMRPEGSSERGKVTTKPIFAPTHTYGSDTPYDSFEEHRYREERQKKRSDYYSDRYNEVREGNRQRYQQEEGGARAHHTNYNRRSYPQQGCEEYHREGAPRRYNSYRQGEREENRYQQRAQQGNRVPYPKQGNPQRPYPAGKGQKFDKRNAPKRKQRPIYEEEPINPDEEVRLNKFLSNAGVCSRREADELIRAGVVLVNGNVVTELGTKITPQDRVEVNGRVVKPENKVYVLLNKPRNCVTTSDDPQERLTVMHLVRTACKERIYPVGRLDRNTTGVLLLTNDGDLAAKLVHPSFKKKKIYHVWLDKEVTVEDMQQIAEGVELEDGEMHADAISYVSEEDRTQVGIEIHSGRNRIVRRIFEHLGYHVVKLDRVYFAGLTKKNLGRGKWRYLTQEEVNYLKMGAFE